MKREIDWEGIKTDFTTGDMSIRDLAKWHRVSEAAVRKRAKAEGWKRIDGAPGAPQKKREIAVTYTVEHTTATTETTDPEAIVGRGRNLALRMLDELDATTSRLHELEAFIAEATDGDESQRRVEAMMRAISLPSRAGTLRALAQAVKTLAETGAAAAPQGKKEQRQAAAQQVGGKFGVRQPPALALVKS